MDHTVQNRPGPNLDGLVKVWPNIWSGIKPVYRNHRARFLAERNQPATSFPVSDSVQKRSTLISLTIIWLWPTVRHQSVALLLILMSNKATLWWRTVGHNQIIWQSLAATCWHRQAKFWVVIALNKYVPHSFDCLFVMKLRLPCQIYTPTFSWLHFCHGVVVYTACLICSHRIYGSQLPQR